jgi:CheY-like chemotaxis protein
MQEEKNSVACPRVLVFDDDEFLRRVSSGLLRRDDPFSVAKVSTIHAAVRSKGGS